MRDKDFLFVASAVAQYKNGARTAKALQRRGVEPGVPDILVLEQSAASPCGILAIELKVGNNPATDLQMKWHDRAKARGHTTAVIKTLQDFKDTVLKHILSGSGTAAAPWRL